MSRKRLRLRRACSERRIRRSDAGHQARRVLERRTWQPAVPSPHGTHCNAGARCHRGPQLTTLAAVYQRSRGAFNLLIRPWSEGGAAVRAERGGLRILTFCSAWAIVRRSRGGLLLRRRARKRRPHVGKVNHVDLSGDGVELAAKAELEAKRLQRVQRRASRNDGGERAPRG